MWAGVDEDYKRVASRLGLAQLNSTGFSVTIAGTLDGVDVSASRFSASQCVTRALIRPPAHLGLAITPASIFGKLGEALSGISSAGGSPLGLLFGGDKLTTGDAELDKAFTIHGHDAASVAALLSPAVRDCLWAIHRADLFFVLTDVYAQIRRRIPTQGEDIEWDLRAVAMLARHVGEAVRAAG
jgi:hypothetical protein